MPLNEVRSAAHCGAHILVSGTRGFVHQGNRFWPAGTSPVMVQYEVSGDPNDPGTTR